MAIPDEKPVIVIAEDQPVERRAMKSLLQDAGFDVQSRSNADEAWEAVEDLTRQGHRTALVTDNNMGADKPTGVDLIQRLQKDHADIPAVLVSSSSGAVEIVQDMHAAGAKVDALKKPVNVEQLITLLHDRLDYPKQNGWQNRIQPPTRPKGRA